MQIVADGSPGGGTTNVLALTEDLIDQGVEVVFCSEGHSYATEEARKLGAEVYDGLHFFRSRIDTRIVNELRAAVKEASADIVHAHGGRAAFAMVRGATPPQLQKMLYTVRGYHFWRKTFLMRFLAERVERKISQSIFRTVHVSQSDQQVAIDRRFVVDNHDSVVIRNGIRLADIPSPNRSSADDEARRLNVAVLGRLTIQKNPHLVLDIAADLANEGFVFHFIGGGDMEAEIRSRAQTQQIHNVIFHGDQSRRDGLFRMSECGTFLMASLWEGLPIAPVEAMAMGLAVVISDVNGCTEVVRDQVDGRVAPSENRAAFVAALRAVVAEPSKTQQMIESGKERVASEFTRKRVVDQHLGLYAECLAD
ncbi:putative glycosyltransferase EpsF [Novipirellula aureliae]|uniref:Putative glycosyltransferase EpsF n=2 Tax=Novipirellula aureliae TaxID=2527966 RepID=A0A5C6E5F5_9BACT|nr:putative glycosyltransferase EpsF [Novipirellula aureliae]